MGLRAPIGGLIALAAAACGGGPSREHDADAASDAAADAGRDGAVPDAGQDAAALPDASPPEPDAGPDASAPDAGVDAGPPEPVICEQIDDFLLVREEGRLEEAHAAAVDDGFVVVYSIRDGDLDVLRMTLLEPCGDIVAESLPVDETGRFIVGARAVALPEGGFAVAWTRMDGDETDDGVVFQLFEPDGRRRGGITTANQTEPRQQVLRTAAALPDGFGLGWVDHSAADFDIRPDAILRAFDEAGVALDDEELLSPAADGVQDLPVLATAADGALVATFHVSPLSPHVRRRSPEGEWIDGEAIVLSEVRKEVTDVALHELQYGFAIVSRAVEEGGDIEVAVMDAGTGAFQVVSVASAAGVDEEGPRIAVLPDVGFLVAWTDESHVEDEFADGVLGIRVLADGTLDGQRFLIPTETAGDQTLQSLASGAGGVLAVWIDYSHADGHEGAALRARLLAHEVAEVAQ